MLLTPLLVVTMLIKFLSAIGVSQNTLTNEKTGFGITMFLPVAGDIGGNMGLFLGCSLLTVFEFVDLLWNFLKSRVNRLENSLEEQRNPEQNGTGIV